ncbi:MAG: hypothetical protein ACREP9_04070, partial [Candidatus Dormibacteraceae bacterium]
WGTDVLHCHGWEVRDRPYGRAPGPAVPATEPRYSSTRWSAPQFTARAELLAPNCSPRSASSRSSCWRWVLPPGAAINNDLIAEQTRTAVEAHRQERIYGEDERYRSGVDLQAG